MAVTERVGEALRDRRIERGLRQQDVADQIGMSRGYVSAVEGGVDWTPPLEVLKHWSVALGWPDDRLVELVNEDQGEPTDLTDFIKAQARDAVGEAFDALIAGEDSPLAAYIAHYIHEDLVRAIYDATDRLLRAEREREAERRKEIAANFNLDAEIGLRGDLHTRVLRVGEPMVVIEPKTGRSKPRRKARAQKDEE